MIEVALFIYVMITIGVFMGYYFGGGDNPDLAAGFVGAVVWPIFLIMFLIALMIPR